MPTYAPRRDLDVRTLSANIMTFLKNVSKTRGRAIYKIGKKVEFLPKLYFLKEESLGVCFYRPVNVIFLSVPKGTRTVLGLGKR